MPLTPEQQAQIERAAEMLEGYAAHLYKLSPFNPDEHPYIPSIEEAAGEMRALLAQLEAQEAPSPMDNLRKNDPAFVAHLERCSAEVATWPKWKRMGYVDGTAEAPPVPALTKESIATLIHRHTGINATQFPDQYAELVKLVDAVLSAEVESVPAQTGADQQAPRPALSKFSTVADYKAAMAKHEAEQPELDVWAGRDIWTEAQREDFRKRNPKGQS